MSIKTVIIGVTVCNETAKVYSWSNAENMKVINFICIFILLMLF